MPSRFCSFELQNSAFFMSASTFVLGLVCFFAALDEKNVLEDINRTQTYSVIMGFMFIVVSIVLLHGTLNVKPNWIYCYLVLSSTCLFIMNIITFMLYPLFSAIFLVLWYGQVCVNSFYKDVVDSKNFIITTFSDDFTIIHVL